MKIAQIVAGEEKEQTIGPFHGLLSDQALIFITPTASSTWTYSHQRQQNGKVLKQCAFFTPPLTFIATKFS
jgi:hypothetical protein